MNHSTSSRLPGRIALLMGHCAGMIDLVALPVWIGTLVSRFGFDAQQAGLLATLFLGGAVTASAWLAPRFGRLPTRLIAAGGYAVAALAFASAASVTLLLPMALLHLLAGVSAGAALSVTNGTIGSSAQPHREFAYAGMALGVFAVAFLGATPAIVARAGGPALFGVFAGVMVAASLACALAFPVRAAPAAMTTAAPARGPLPREVWLGIVGIAAMALVQSMTFSFLERVGAERGFTPQALGGVLIALGLVNLLPAGLAALLERRLHATRVVASAAVVQALLVGMIMNATQFAPWAAAASVFAAVIIFSHVFAFGLLARMDASGRAMAATPAMVMVGAGMGPLLGGTLVKNLGYGSLSMAALLIDGLALLCFLRIAFARPEPAVKA